MLNQLSFSFAGAGFGVCRICKRPLSNPQSVQAGIGPICAGGRGHQLSNKKNETDADYTDHQLPNSLTDGLILKRDDDGVWTNAPHLVTHHSPDGFEFGYGGSGPADLALNVVEAVLRQIDYTGEVMTCWDKRQCFEKAWDLHQEFKLVFIAGAEDNTVIPYANILSWIDSRLEQ